MADSVLGWFLVSFLSSTIFWIFCTISLNVLAVCDSGFSNMKGVSRSVLSVIFGSMGICPRRFRFISWLIFLPPPAPRISYFSPHLGHMKPLMFSIIPIMGMFIFRAIETAFLTTYWERSEGAVIIIAPSISGMSCIMFRGSSPVPGGKSTRR